MAVDILRKRQEKFYLIVALKGLGSLYYSLSNLVQAEENWQDALDTVFQ